MTETVNVHEAKTHFSKLLERALAGDEIIVARRGVPLVKLVPLTQSKARRLGFLEVDVPDSFFEPLPPDEMGVA